MKKISIKGFGMLLSAILMASILTACEFPFTEVLKDSEDSILQEDIGDDEIEDEGDESIEDSKEEPLKLLFLEGDGGPYAFILLEDGQNYQWNGYFEQLYLCYDKKVKSISSNLFVDYEGDAIQDHFCILSVIETKSEMDSYPEYLEISVVYEDGETEDIKVSISYESEFLESTNVSSDAQLADSVRTAILVTMENPLVVNATDYNPPTSGNLVSVIENAGPTFKQEFEEYMGWTAEECIEMLGSKDARGIYIDIENNNVIVTIVGSHADGEDGSEPIIIGY